MLYHNQASFAISPKHETALVGFAALPEVPGGDSGGDGHRTSGGGDGGEAASCQSECPLLAFAPPTSETAAQGLLNKRWKAGPA